MKRLIIAIVFGSVAGALSLKEAAARDLTYKIGAGYKQAYTNARVLNSGAFGPTQLNGLEVSYGIAKDLHVGAYLGMLGNFDFAMFGPSFRYDFQRIISRNPTVWKHLNLFLQVAFLMKAGGETKEGVTLQLPYMGFEIMPFDTNDFAISTSAGFVIDFVEESKIGFTNGMFGDVGVKYYF